MPVLGLRAWFPTSAAGEFNYGPDGGRGPQIFFYQALEPSGYSRHGTGLQHLSFMVATARSFARRTSGAGGPQRRDRLRTPGVPEYGQRYATFFLDPHGFMLEVVCHDTDELTEIASVLLQT